MVQKGCGRGDREAHGLDCGRSVLETQQGIACDACGFWHRLDCGEVGSVMQCVNEFSYLSYPSESFIAIQRILKAIKA